MPDAAPPNTPDTTDDDAYDSAPPARAATHAELVAIGAAADEVADDDKDAARRFYSALHGTA